jgi:hypothetical protein
MAAPHVFVSTTIEDAKGAKSTMQFNFPVGAASNTNVNALIDAAKAAAELIDAVTKGRILNVGIGIAVDLSALTLKSTADVDSDVEEGARFQFNSAIGALTGFRIPTFDEALLLSGTQSVDIEDADVDALVDFMIDGHTLSAVTVQPSDDRGSDVESLASARESFQSSR